MVRSGSRAVQVLSSGKHTGPGKLVNGKRGIYLRKVSRLNADSGCPNHSDSESQETLQGLDSCAALLRDILKKEDSGSEVPYSENRSNTRLLEGKRFVSKRKGHEKCTVPVVVRRENVSSDNKKQVLNKASSGSERDSLDVAQNQSLQDHYRMYSPIIYQALCEHVQTQMSLINNVPAKNNSGNTVLPCHTVSGSETHAVPSSCSGLSTSTPGWLPQQPLCPQMVHTAVQTDDGNPFASQTKTLSVNSTDVLRNSFSSNLGVPYRLTKTDKSAVPTFSNSILPQEVLKEPDLLKCFQTYIDLLCSHGKESQLESQIPQSTTLSQPAFLATNEEKVAREKIGELTSEEKDLNIQVQDSRTKDLQKAKDVNQCTEKIRTVKYLLGELKALGVEHGDTEVQRLITELDQCISLLPAVHENKSIQVEIALAMQPLRSENAQLRRQLRILNQQLKGQEKNQKASDTVECNLELFSLQSLNNSLQNQLEESLKNQELLQNKNEELLKVIENQKDENRKIAGLFKEKDQILLENKQQFDIEMTRMKMELEETLVNMKNSQFKLEATEKENQILGITLRQRDAEVTRLRELTRTLQSSMAKLLADLSTDRTRCRPGNNLTKSLLNIYDKQPQHDPISTHTSVMSYLNKLETDHTFIPPDSLSTVIQEENMEPDRSYAVNVLPSKVSQYSDIRSVEEISPPGIVSTPSKENSEACETMTLIGDECNVDNTVYIPFARSTPKKSLTTQLSPQPHVHVASPQLVSNSNLGEKKKPCAAVACSSSKEDAEDALEMLSRPHLEDKKLLKKIKEAIGKIPVVGEELGDLAACPGPPTCHSSSVQVKDSLASDASFFTSDMNSDWSISSFSTFTSRDEQDFRNGLAALDANIARLQKSLRTGVLDKGTLSTTH